MLPHIYGTRVPSLPDSQSDTTVSRPPLGKDTSKNELKEGINYGSRGYQDGLTRQQVETHEKISVLMVVREMDTLVPGSLSLANIVGSPSTGKTRTVLVYIGTDMHDSRYGHFT